jgi:hypothetical protein
MKNAAIFLKNTTTRKTMWLLNVLTGQEYDCRPITAERNKAKKSLGGGWFQFVRDNHLQESSYSVVY